MYCYRLQELQERGWIDQLVRQRINNGTICQLPPGKEEGQRPAVPLTLSQMWGVFAIMGVGEGLDVLVGLSYLSSHTPWKQNLTSINPLMLQVHHCLHSFLWSRCIGGTII